METTPQCRSGKNATVTYCACILTGELMALLGLRASSNQRLLALTILGVYKQGKRGNDLASLQAHLGKPRISPVNMFITGDNID